MTTVPHPLHRTALTVVFATLIAAGATTPVAAQNPPGGRETREATVLWHEAPALFPVRVVEPPGFDSSKTYPAVVALHGFGSAADRFERVTRPFTDAGYLVIIPQGPYFVVPAEDTVAHWSWGRNLWTPVPLTDDPGVDFATTILTAEAFVPSALGHVRERYRLAHTTVFGFSQGGVFAVGTGFYRRDEFDAVIAFGVRGPARDWFTFRGGQVEDGSDTPVLLVVGRQDPLFPFVDAERGRDVYREAGYDVTLHEFEGGHTVPLSEVHRALEWLEDRRARHEE